MACNKREKLLRMGKILDFEQDVHKASVAKVLNLEELKEILGIWTKDGIDAAMDKYYIDTQQENK